MINSDWELEWNENLDVDSDGTGMQSYWTREHFFLFPDHLEKDSR